jgi:hypothetical protein
MTRTHNPRHGAKRALEAPKAMELEIRDDVPMPTRQLDTGELYNTMKKMEVGQCIDLPYPRFQRSSVGSIAKRAGIKIITRYLCLHRVESNDQIDTLRIWRKE